MGEGVSEKAVDTCWLTDMYEVSFWIGMKGLSYKGGCDRVEVYYSGTNGGGCVNAGRVLMLGLVVFVMRRVYMYLNMKMCVVNVFVFLVRLLFYG